MCRRLRIRDYSENRCSKWQSQCCWIIRRGIGRRSLITSCSKSMERRNLSIGSSILRTTSITPSAILAVSRRIIFIRKQRSSASVFLRIRKCWRTKWSRRRVHVFEDRLRWIRCRGRLRGRRPANHCHQRKNEKNDWGIWKLGRNGNRIYWQMGAEWDDDIQSYS